VILQEKLSNFLVVVIIYISYLLGNVNEVYNVGLFGARALLGSLVMDIKQVPQY